MVFVSACLVFSAGLSFSAEQVDRKPAVTAVAMLPTICVAEEKTPDSLHLWHLYEPTDVTAAVGDEISFVGRVEYTGNKVHLENPPWFMVAFSKEESFESDRAKTYQVFSFQYGKLPEVLDVHSFARFTAKVLVNRPDLSIDEKSQRNIPLFSVEPVKTTLVRFGRPFDDLKKSATIDIRTIEPRLRELCGRYNLSYDFDANKLSYSWYRGSVAFTSIVTRHPVFSLKPVPYATISALYEPETGRLSGFVFMRRIWQDPPD
jgi:hypothetical protein